MVDIYRAGFQLTKVKGFMLFAALCAAGAVYWGWDLFSTYGTAPGDGGVLAPIGQRLAWGLGVAGLGLAFLAAMWSYGRLYATRIRYDPAADALHVGTLEFLATRTRVHAASDVEDSSYHHGRMQGEGVSVDAPWFTLRLRGRRWPLIVDAQGVFPDRALAARLLKVPGIGSEKQARAAVDMADFHHGDLDGLDAAEGRRRWRLRWLLSLGEYADAAGQRRAWLDPNNPYASFGFTECTGCYMEDLNLKDGGYDWALARGFVTPDETGAVAGFDRLVRAYAGPIDTPESRDEDLSRDVLADPAWQDIVEEAQRAQSALLDRLSDAEEIGALSRGLR